MGSEMCIRDRIGDRNETWPKPYLTGRDQLWRLADREAEQE